MGQKTKGKQAPPIVSYGEVRVHEEALKEQPGMDGAIRVQIAKRHHRMALVSRLKVITGGKT
jgi:hypothetical protein